MGARDAGRRVLVGLTILILLAGCSSSASPTPAAGGAAASASSPLIYDPHANPQADIDAAVAAAKADGRRVLIDFGADWSGDCTALAADFASPKIKPFLDANFHVVRVYIGHWDTNQAVQDKYAAGKFMPMIAVLDSTGATFYRGDDLESAASMSVADVMTYHRSGHQLLRRRRPPSLNNGRYPASDSGSPGGLPYLTPGFVPGAPLPSAGWDAHRATGAVPHVEPLYIGRIMCARGRPLKPTTPSPL
jgi:Thioredoxin-like